MVRPPPDEAMALARVERFAEFRRPMPVDRWGVAGGRLVPVPPGANARFHVGVLDYHRGDFALASYHRTPWATMAWKTLLHALLTTKLAANGERIYRHYYDSLVGSSIFEDMRIYGPSGTDPTHFYNQTDAFDNADFRLSYDVREHLNPGQSSTAGIQAYTVTLTAGPTFDDALFRVTASGSRVHTDAVRNEGNGCGASMYWNDAAAVRRPFAIDGTGFSSFPINVGQTVALAFQGQF